MSETANHTSETTPAESLTGYAETVAAGVREHELFRFEEARSLFLRAHHLYPSARTARALGKVEFELRNYGDSVKYLDEALASAVKPLDSALRAEVQILRERAMAYLGELHLAIEPGSATVSVDGVNVATGPSASLTLLVGDHILEFHAQGRLPERRAVHIRGRDSTSLRVFLSELPVADDGRPRNDVEDQSTRASGSGFLRQHGRWFWPVVGVAFVGVVTGVSVALTRDRHSVANPTLSPNTPPGAQIETAVRF